MNETLLCRCLPGIEDPEGTVVRLAWYERCDPALGAPNLYLCAQDHFCERNAPGGEAWSRMEEPPVCVRWVGGAPEALPEPSLVVALIALGFLWGVMALVGWIVHRR